MFKVKNKKTGEIIQVLDTTCDEYGGTWFLIWINDGWRWRAANNYVPPNYEPKKKWIVAGSRSFNNYILLCQTLNTIKDNIECIVCGEAKGADILGANYAYDNNIKIKSFPADWQKYGAAAGYVRNKQMAEYADAAIVFWDGASPGSKDMIEQMNKLGKEVQVIYYNKPRID